MSNDKKREEALFDAVPDYLRGSVDARTRTDIEALIDSNQDFARQVEAERQIYLSMNSSQQSTANPQFSALKARIESVSDQSGQDIGSSPSSYFKQVAIAAGVSLFAVGLVLQTQFATSPDEPAFETLSNAPASIAAEPSQRSELVRLIFAPSASDTERDALAGKYGLILISDSAALDSVVYEVPQNADIDALVSSLQGSALVDFASATESSE